jgi:16S rRNA A1518/A1519 N6-dimethyltransferase RsmA/KsgA/DIM1 with predicted DNA glycosylase/AP lyase activity
MLDQHMIRDMTGYERLLRSLDIRGRTVVEFGVGTGLLTRAILAQSPAKVIGYEIDRSLVPGDLTGHPSLDLRMKDFTMEDFGFLDGIRYAFISNPPYSELAFIRDLIVRHPPEILVMMVSAKKKDIYFPDDKVALNFSQDDFAPPTRGGHVVIVRASASAL